MLKAIDNSLKAALLRVKEASTEVWIGQLDQSVTWKLLQEHFKQAGKVTWAVVFPKGGSGCVAFSSAEEAESALQLNGSQIGP